MLNDFLSRIGLTENEKKIYLHLLKTGSSIASMIGKRLTIKRVTVYASLQTLIKKELITSFQKNNVTYFQTASPEDIVRFCEIRINRDLELKNEAERLLVHLKTIQASQAKPILEIKDKLKYYQGLEAVKRLINETLDEGKKEQLCFGLNKYHTENFWDEWVDYTQRRTKVGMNVRSVQPDIFPAKAYKKRDKNELRVTRLIPHTKFPAHSELNVIGDMVALFTSHGKEPTGMKFYSKDMAQVLRSLFELAWEKAEEYDEKLSK